jgi:ribosomal protein S18 acetylase RimI-like enzyme
VNKRHSEQISAEYREMTVLDFDRMLKLWKRTSGIGLSDADSPCNIEIFLKRNPGLSFICESGGKLVGTVLCGHDGRRGYIYHLAVDENYRLSGIGKELMNRSLERLGDEGIVKCHLFLFSDNETAMQFYKNTGWAKREDLLIFSKNI